MLGFNSHFTGDETMTAVDVNLSGTYPLFGRDHDLMVGYGEAKNDNESPLLKSINPKGYDTVADWNDMGSIPVFQDIDTGLAGVRDIIKQKSGYLATRFNLTDDWHGAEFA